RDLLLVGRVPDVGLVDERELDHLVDHLGQAGARGDLEDRVVEEEVLADEIAQVLVRPEVIEAVAALTQHVHLRRRDALARAPRAPGAGCRGVLGRPPYGCARSPRGSAWPRPAPRPGASTGPRGRACG